MQKKSWNTWAVAILPEKGFLSTNKAILGQCMMLESNMLFFGQILQV